MMIALLLFILGLALSAFFSGNETGMYRVPRIRLVLDALAGRRVARGLVWLLNRPTLFVATMLVGNNIANYVTSLAIVLAVPLLWVGAGAGAEIAAAVLVTPLIFILAELLPKHLFYFAPYRLLRAGGPLLLLFFVLLAPIAGLVGLLGRALSALTGETPFRVRVGMARGELEEIIREGHEAGLLAGSQRVLAQNVFQIGNQAAIRFGTAADRLPIVRPSTDAKAARAAAQQRGQSLVLVGQQDKLRGYWRYAELLAAPDGTTPPLLPLLRAADDEKHLAVLLRMYEAGSEVALLIDRRRQLRGVVTRRQLLEPLLGTTTPYASLASTGPPPSRK